MIGPRHCIVAMPLYEVASSQVEIYFDKIAAISYKTQQFEAFYIGFSPRGRIRISWEEEVHFTCRWSQDHMYEINRFLHER